MTPSILRNVLLLVPEIAPLVKQASLEEAFPVYTRDDAVVSALKAEYLLKIAHQPMHQEDYARIQMAVALHHAGDMVKAAADQMLSNTEVLTKQASSEEGLVKQAEHLIEDSLCGLSPNLDAASAAARNLVTRYGDLVKSATVRRLGGGDEFHDAYARAALYQREVLCPGFGYGDIGDALEKTAGITRSQACNVSETVRKLDEASGLRFQGWDFYHDAWITKQALTSSLMIRLAGREVPIESILPLPISSMLGEDIGKAVNGHPAEAKAVLESLPLPQQSLLLSRI